MNDMKKITKQMDDIYNEFASDRDKVKKEIHQIDGAIEYISNCKYMTDEEKYKEVRVFLSRANVLAVKLMDLIQEDMKIN